jgi:hypothetical protein
MHVDMTMNKMNAATLVAIKFGFGASLALGFGMAMTPMSMAHADTSAIQAMEIRQGVTDGLGSL